MHNAYGTGAIASVRRAQVEAGKGKCGHRDATGLINGICTKCYDRAATLEAKLERWRRELESLQVTDRWGEARRFQSNARRIARRAWLIDHIADAQAKLKRIHGEAQR